ncbi:homodimeric glycerol 3-phosphate dehydrogenase (quinone) [Devosia lucknowensis]|uniref:Homodimeric glycerol 3-phosphate dehydrogenase (Quinone) n=1 Tax=Devosia lucknowensis TaxID=1096929 RepID=A0A1Y6E8I6_9HYPH|nr:glycerol-3-phosphate dehydrogenase [Devosia lucknowensis]SMQ58927.1 homodimeric glycerol 3-phosphate dehydrogenase (quinone) [Devosia lucknowensis]
MLDIFVVGGGINGASVARDAVGRGFTVAMAEMNDLASGTSSAATKLIHGGLRYLEHYEFRLVHEALAEREVLWAAAPHIIWPLRFVLPHHKGLRPAVVLRAGLAMYDYMGGRRLLPPTKTLDLKRDEAGKPLKPGYGLAFEYSDCWVNDARFVVLNARDAADRGATVHVRTKVTSARREDGGWTIELDGEGGRETVRARMLINAAGPWVDEVINGVMGKNGAHNVRLVQGSHIVVRKLYDHDRCYFFQNGDGRIFFAIPYEDDFTLIGTTDRDYHGDPRDVQITEEETDYLLSAANEYFAQTVGREDIVWTYSGVRPLFDDGASAAQEATRDYVLKMDGDLASGAVINVFGGKLTTSRRLAESVLEKIEEVLGKKGEAWTKTSTLPGGDFGVKSFDAEVRRLGLDYPELPGTLLKRLMRLYGTRARTLLGDARTVGDLGQNFGADLYALEVVYLAETEWARTAEDVLWRRTKLGLRIGAEDVARLEAFLRARK